MRRAAVYVARGAVRTPVFRRREGGWLAQLIEGKASLVGAGTTRAEAAADLQRHVDRLLDTLDIPARPKRGRPPVKEPNR